MRERPSFLVVDVASGPRARLRARLEPLWPGPWTTEAAVLAACIAVLVAVGLVMSFSASFVDAAQTGDPFSVFVRQLVWAGIGVPVFLLVAAVDHRRWRTPSWILLGVAVAGLVAIRIPGVGLEVYGSTRWIGFGPVVVQPSELAKLALLLWLADVLHRKRPPDGREQATKHLLIPALPALAIVGALVLAQPDLGTTLLLGLIVGLILYAEGLRLHLFAGLAVAGGLLAAVAAAVAPYRLARVTGWLDPEAEPLGSGYQLLQSLYALGSGGVAGVGLGSGRGKWNFIPNPETDFIFSIVGEELGFVGAFAVLALFAVVMVTGMRVARLAPDPFGRTVALAITGWLVGQALLNVSTVTGLLPITGVTLPLLSVGGSSLVSTLAALGILVAIARSVGTRP